METFINLQCTTSNIHEKCNHKTSSHVDSKFTMETQTWKPTFFVFGQALIYWAMGKGRGYVLHMYAPLWINLSTSFTPKEYLSHCGDTWYRMFSRLGGYWEGQESPMIQLLSNSFLLDFFICLSFISHGKGIMRVSFVKSLGRTPFVFMNCKHVW